MTEKQIRDWKELAGSIRKNRSIRIFATAILFRLLIYMIYFCIMAMFGSYQEEITFENFLDALKRWDSYHYLNIAENGYHGAVENGNHIFLVFYPLYPCLIKAVSLVVGNAAFAAVLVSDFCYGMGCVYFDKLMCREFGKEASENAVALISVFPFAFFFGSVMTESLFFMVSAAFLYHLRRHEWWEVMFFGFLACMTKIQGALLAFAVVAELFYSCHGFWLLRTGRWKVFFKKIVFPGLKCVPMLGGLAVYLVINYVVEGDFFRFMYYQEHHWNHTLGPIWNTLSYMWDYVKGGWFTSDGMSLWVPQFLLFFINIVVIIYGVIKGLRPTYLVYLILFYLMTYSSTWLISGGRYNLSALPFFMLGGKFMADYPKTKNLILMTSFGLMIVYMAGYFQGKQIM